MALVREHGGYGGGLDSAEAAAFDALGFGYGYGYGHGALLGFDASSSAAAALFGDGASSSAYVSDGGDASWTGGAGGTGASSTVLAFNHGAAAVGEEEDEESDAWIDAMDNVYGAVSAPAPAAAAPEPPRHALTASVGFDASTGCFTLTERPSSSSSPSGGGAFGLLFPSTSSSGGAGTTERATTAAPVRGPQKRTYVSAEAQAVSPTKKHCGGAGRKASKAKAASTSTCPTKDPQSLAAKNRRERISERLRTLQELVPNGTKVDLVTMLEKAISYVKFLQLQVKVLATDEFWPAQGGKAPEISQVREALDAILSSASQRGQLN